MPQHAPENLTLRKTTIANNRAITIVIHAADNADVFWQTINPRTGKGWQRARDLRHFHGKLANMQALQAFNRLVYRPFATGD